MVQDALTGGGGRRIPLLAFSLGTMAFWPISGGLAQTASDHAARAHGKPIVNGHPVQPSPKVVQERWRHHEQMLQSESKPSGGSSSPDSTATRPIETRSGARNSRSR